MLDCSGDIAGKDTNTYGVEASASGEQDAGYVDVYSAGSPQPFSKAGKKEGREDSKGRGVVVFHTMADVDYAKAEFSSWRMWGTLWTWSTTYIVGSRALGNIGAIQASMDP